MAHGQFSHLEIAADDPARAKRFYGALFGWEFGEMPEFPDYFLFSVGKIDSAGGAIGKRNVSAGDKTRLYISVDAIDPLLARIPELGGKVKMARTEIPGQGWYAVVDDSEGNELALYENAPNSRM